jgi:ribosomal protein S18 acetylase RimI-like enzyme
MAVRPGDHGHGVATRLLEAAEGALRQRVCTYVTLDTTSPLRRAIAFYEKHGYRRTGRRSEVLGMTLIEYAKRLHSP